MPIKPKLQNARVATALNEAGPDIPVFMPLVMEERDKLKAILADPVLIKAWKNAESVAPPLFPSSVGQFEGQFGDANAARALARRQGWEMHKAALLKQTVEPRQKNKGAPEDYPNSGTLESEIKQHLPKK